MVLRDDDDDDDDDDTDNNICNTQNIISMLLPLFLLPSTSTST